MAQANNIFQGVECGATTCFKQDQIVGGLMIPLILIGTISTIVSIFTFCRKTSNSYDEDLMDRKYNRLDRCADYLKIWGENVPMLFLIIYWMFFSGGIFERYSFISTTTIVSLIVSGFNFYWVISPLLCKCCLCLKGENGDNTVNKYQSEQQIQNNEVQLSTQPVVASGIHPTNAIPQPVMMVQPVQMVHQPIMHQPVVSASYGQEPAAAQVQLPPGWSQCVDPNGRIYYQNNVTQQTQWETPSAVGVAVPQYAPSVPSDMAPRPMVNDHIDAQFDDNPESYYEHDSGNDISCACRCCMWCGCCAFSIPLIMVLIFSTLFATAVTDGGLDQSFGQLLSTDDQCITATNFHYKITDLYSNVTGESYGFWFVYSTEELYPLLDTGGDPFASVTGDDLYQGGVVCQYVAIPGLGECKKWIFDCSDYDIVYTVEELCSDFCPS